MLLSSQTRPTRRRALQRKLDANESYKALHEMALDTWRVDMAVGGIDPLMAFMERNVIHTCIEGFYVANGCFGLRSDLGHCPSHVASASQKNPGKSRLAILWFAPLPYT